MKKFKLQTGQVITVDDCDAYLLRSYVWHGSTSARSPGTLAVKRASAGHRQVLLSHEVLGIPEGAEARARPEAWRQGPELRRGNAQGQTVRGGGWRGAAAGAAVWQGVKRSAEMKYVAAGESLVPPLR